MHQDLTCDQQDDPQIIDGFPHSGCRCISEIVFNTGSNQSHKLFLQGGHKPAPGRFSSNEQSQILVAAYLSLKNPQEFEK